MAKLFLCDDDEGYRGLLRAVFAGGEHEVVGEGCDGDDCIRRASGCGAEVVLLDLNMPGKSGAEALPELRAAMPDAKIIVLTTASALDERQTVMDLGADGFIQKPLNALTLVGHLRDALDAAA